MIKKGFILIYTLVVISLSFFIVLVCFNVENMRKCNNIESEQCVLNSENDKYKQILFTRFNNMMEEQNVVDKKIYILSKNNLVLNNGDYVLKYDNKKDNFMFMQFNNSRIHRIDIYDYTVEKNVVRFRYKYTSY